MNEVVKLEQHLDHLSSHWFRDLNNRLIVTTTHTICHSGPENSSKESLNHFHDFFPPWYFYFGDIIRNDSNIKRVFCKLDLFDFTSFFCLWLLKNFWHAVIKSIPKTSVKLIFFGLDFISFSGSLWCTSSMISLEVCILYLAHKSLLDHLTTRGL